MSPDVLSSVCKQQSANEAMAQLIETIKVQYFRCSLSWRMIVGHGQLLFQIRASAHIVLRVTMLAACCYAMFLCFVQIRQNSLPLVWWIPGNLDMTLLIASITAWIKRSPSSLCQCAVHVFLQMLDNVSTQGDNLQLTSQ